MLNIIYDRLYRAYGPQGWWPGDGPFDVVVGAILTQSAAWSNVEMAISNLKEASCWSLDAIHHMPQPQLADIIRPSGYFNAKARKLKAFASHVCNNYDGDLMSFLSQPDMAQLRRELLAIHGIGPETADDILVYAALRPSFVIDSYTKRILGRIGFEPPGGGDEYHRYQELFHSGLANDVDLFNEYHALLDRHAKVACAKVPRCSDCCLLDLCSTGRSLFPAPPAENVQAN